MSIHTAIRRVAIHEALSQFDHKEMAYAAAESSIDETGRTAAQRLSDHVFGKSDRISIPLEHVEAKPHKELVEHLASHGYEIKDYANGIATKTKMVGNPEKGIPMQEKKIDVAIGKALNETNAHPDIRSSFENDLNRMAVKATVPLKLVISRHPHDVAAMSTGQHWQSCQTLGGDVLDKKTMQVKRTDRPGIMNGNVRSAISAGAHVAYLVKHEDDIHEHNKPLSRMSLNPFSGSSIDGKDSHQVLRPSGITYGHQVSGIHETLQKWSEKNFPTKSGIVQYKRHEDVYPEGQRDFFNMGHDESMENLRKGHTKILSENWDSKFIHSAIDHIADNDFRGMSDLVTKNSGMMPEHYSHLMDKLEQADPKRINAKEYTSSTRILVRHQKDRAIAHGLKMMDHFDNHAPTFPSMFGAAPAQTHSLDIGYDLMDHANFNRATTHHKLVSDVYEQNMKSAEKHIENGRDGMSIHHDKLGENHRQIIWGTSNPEHGKKILSTIKELDHPVYNAHVGHMLENGLSRGTISSEDAKPIAEHILTHESSQGDPADSDYTRDGHAVATGIAAEHTDLHHLVRQSGILNALKWGGTHTRMKVPDFLNKADANFISTLKP